MLPSSNVYSRFLATKTFGDRLSALASPMLRGSKLQMRRHGRLDQAEARLLAVSHSRGNAPSTRDDPFHPPKGRETCEVTSVQPSTRVSEDPRGRGGLPDGRSRRGGGSANRSDIAATSSFDPSAPASRRNPPRPTRRGLSAPLRPPFASSVRAFRIETLSPVCSMPSDAFEGKCRFPVALPTLEPSTEGRRAVLGS